MEITMYPNLHRFIVVILGVFLLGVNTASFAQYYPGTRISFNPGHYVAIHKDADLASRYAQNLVRAPFIGVNKPYTWKYLEKSKGVYDFSRIERDIALMKGRGMKLIISIREKTFTYRETALPDYLINSRNPQYSAAYKGGQTINKQGGYTPKKWVPAVSERLRALYTQLGTRFNGRVEAIQIMETATSLPGSLTPADYSDAGYANAIISNMSALKHAFPNTVVQQQLNGMGGNRMAEVINAAKAAKIGISTVDTHPYVTRWWDVVYKYFMPFSNSRYAPVGALVEGHNYGASSPTSSNYISAREIAVFSTTKLGANYIFWGPPNAAIVQDVRNTIPKYKTVLQP